LYKYLFYISSIFRKQDTDSIRCFDMSLECNEHDLDNYQVHFLLTNTYNADDVDGVIYYDVFVSVGLAGSGWTGETELPCIIYLYTDKFFTF